MQFVMNRDVIVWAKDGTHSIGFKKGEPMHVPSKMKGQVMEMGGQPADEKTQEELDKVEVSKDTAAPTDPIEREDAIRDVLQTILDRNESRDFTASNRPKIDVIRAAAGFQVDVSESDKLWDDMLAGTPTTEMLAANAQAEVEAEAEAAAVEDATAAKVKKPAAKKKAANKVK